MDPETRELTRLAGMVTPGGSPLMLIVATGLSVLPGWTVVLPGRVERLLDWTGVLAGCWREEELCWGAVFVSWAGLGFTLEIGTAWALPTGLPARRLEEATSLTIVGLAALVVDEAVMIAGLLTLGLPSSDCTGAAEEFI